MYRAEHTGRNRVELAKAASTGSNGRGQGYGEVQ